MSTANMVYPDAKTADAIRGLMANHHPAVPWRVEPVHNGFAVLREDHIAKAAKAAPEPKKPAKDKHSVPADEPVEALVTLGDQYGTPSKWKKPIIQPLPKAKKKNPLEGSFPPGADPIAYASYLMTAASTAGAINVKVHVLQEGPGGLVVAPAPYKTLMIGGGKILARFDYTDGDKKMAMLLLPCEYAAKKGLMPGVTLGP